MSAERNRPGVRTEAIEATAGGPFAYLKNTAEIDLTQISEGSPNPRYEVFLHGWALGFESREADIARLTWERDLWYFCHTNRKSPTDFYRHQTNLLWEVAQ